MLSYSLPTEVTCTSYATKNEIFMQVSQPDIKQNVPAYAELCCTPLIVSANNVYGIVLCYKNL